MNLEQFLEKIEKLLEEGQRSQATDLLAEFLSGKPDDLRRAMMNLQGLSRNSPREVVGRLKAVFFQKDLSDDFDEESFADCEDFNDDDLDLIEADSREFEIRATHYELDEEIEVKEGVKKIV